MANNYNKKGYKASHNYMCNDFKYEVGKTYSMKEQPSVCRNGFHYCKKAKDTLNYYGYSENFNLFEIKDLSNYTDLHEDKCATNKIKIVREITDPDELFSLLGFYRKHNKKGRLIFEKTKNCEVKYDEQGDLIFEKTKYEECSYYKTPHYEIRRLKSRKTKNEETHFNKQSRIIKHIDLNKRITTKYTYSSDNVLLRTTSSNGYKYVANKHGQVILEIKPNGLKKKVSYNKDGLIVKTQYSNGKFEIFEYTDDNRLLNYVNTDGTTIKNIYKNNKLVRSEENIIKTYKNGVKNCNFTY